MRTTNLLNLSNLLNLPTFKHERPCPGTGVVRPRPTTARYGVALVPGEVVDPVPDTPPITPLNTYDEYTQVCAE